MQVWTSVALAIVGWFVPLALSSSGVSITTANYGGLEETEDICSPFEVLKPAEPCCEPTCEDDCTHAICRRAPSVGSTPTCVCRQGYVRHKGACINKAACPAPCKQPSPSVTYGSYDSYRPIPLTKSVLNVQKKCSQNEKLTPCRPLCEETCDYNCKHVPPMKTCIPEPSCVCEDGFVRHDGRCIKKCDCPRRNPILRRPLSGDYVDFEVMSLEEMKSDEDYEYCLPKHRNYKNEMTFSRYAPKKNPMIPVYLRTVSSEPKPSACCTCKGSSAEKPALFPPLCACRAKQHAQPPTYTPKLDENTSYESTEEDSDIVPYVPPVPSTRPYHQKPSPSLFPPNMPHAPGPYYAPRMTAPMPSPHRIDLNEPVDHFYGSGQATSAQQTSAGQEEYRRPLTIWPPVNSACKCCGLNRKVVKYPK